MDSRIARNNQNFCSPAQCSSNATLFSFFCFIDYLSFPSERPRPPSLSPAGTFTLTEKSSLNFGRASIVTNTSSGISPSSKCKTREQVRQTNSKSWVTMKMTFPILDNRRINPATCVILSKSRPLVGSSNTSRVFPTNHTDGYRHPLFLTAGKCVWMAFPIWGKPQFFQSCIYQRLVWISDAKGTFCFYAVSEKLIVHILHDHIRALQPFLTLNRLAFPQKLSIAVFVKPTESARKCSLSSSIVADHANHFALSRG